MSAIVERKRITFQPPDTCAIGPVKVYGPTGELIRTIPVAELQKRRSAVPLQHALVIPPRAEPWPSFRDRAKGQEPDAPTGKRRTRRA